MKIARTFLPLALLIFLVPMRCGKKQTTTDSVNTLLTKEGLKTITVAIELYRQEFGEFPDSLEELLRKKGITDSRIIRDAWGRIYYYRKEGGLYLLYSKGSDGTPATGDDVHPPLK